MQRPKKKMKLAFMPTEKAEWLEKNALFDLRKMSFLKKKFFGYHFSLEETVYFSKEASCLFHEHK